MSKCIEKVFILQIIVEIAMLNLVNKCFDDALHVYSINRLSEILGEEMPFHLG